MEYLFFTEDRLPLYVLLSMAMIGGEYKIIALSLYLFDLGYQLIHMRVPKRDKRRVYKIGAILIMAFMLILLLIFLYKEYQLWILPM